MACSWGRYGRTALWRPETGCDIPREYFAAWGSTVAAGRQDPSGYRHLRKLSGSGRSLANHARSGLPVLLRVALPESPRTPISRSLRATYGLLERVVHLRNP